MQPFAIWDSARDVWETPQTEGFFCEHLDVFLATFPTSGMTVNGAAYELPTWDPATHGSASSSLLPTVTTQDGANNGGPSQFDRNTPPLNTRVLMLLKTPTSQLAVNGGSQHPDKRREGGHGPTLADEIEHLLPQVTDTSATAPHGGPKTPRLLRTPCAAEAEGGPRNPNRPGATMRLSDQIREQLLPTPSACVANDGESTETWLARRERVKLTAANGNGMGMPLTIATLLIGESTPQPSDAGNAPLDGQLRGQLNLLDAITDTD